MLPLVQNHRSEQFLRTKILETADNYLQKVLFGKKMSKLNRNKSVPAGIEVFVYFNLRKKLFSVKSKETGRVIAHANCVRLKNATFKISNAGRLRALKAGQRNVHAGIEGILVSIDDLKGLSTELKSFREASYHYRFAPYFFYCDTKKEVEKNHSAVILYNRRVHLPKLS